MHFVLVVDYMVLDFTDYDEYVPNLLFVIFYKVFQQARRLHNEIIFSLTSIARLVVYDSGMYYLFCVKLHHHFVK